MLLTGLLFCYTIIHREPDSLSLKNDLPGCFTLSVKQGKTYLLRIINAALNDEVFLRIARHHFTVVEVDATYVKPFRTDTILIAPGQTTNALLTAEDHQDPGASRFLITVSPFMDSPIDVDNVTGTAILEYSGASKAAPTVTAMLPPLNATWIEARFMNALRSLNSQTYPAKVPLEIDHSLFFTVGLGINPCPTCPTKNRVVAYMNNVTFAMPSTALLQAHYYNTKGVFTDDFPAKPPVEYNYTGRQPLNLQTMEGTRLYRLSYNSTVQIILQDTGMIAPENHPIHLHGFNFFAVGRGLGNFNPEKDPEKFNLVDPAERNTIGVPSGGWTAIRFRADNPGKQISCNKEKNEVIGS